MLDDCQGASDVKVEVVGAAPGDLVVKTYRNGKGELLDRALAEEHAGRWLSADAGDAQAAEGCSGAVIVDTLYGYQQQATVKPTEGGVELPGLLVGDWPLILRILP